MESEFIQIKEEAEQILIKEELSLSPDFKNDGEDFQDDYDDEDDEVDNGDDDDMDYSPR